MRLLSPAFYALTALLCVSSPLLAQSDARTSCLHDIEHWMREYQARHEFVTADDNLSTPLHHVEWPSCCPGSKAPFFPPDNYYDDAIEGNPEFAASLVQALRDAFCGNGIYTNFLKSTNPSNKLHNDETIRDRFQNEDFPELDCAAGQTVTPENMCDILDDLRKAIPKLKGVIVPTQCKDVCWRSGGSRDYHAGLTAAEAESYAEEAMNESWGNSEWVCYEDGTAPCSFSVYDEKVTYETWPGPPHYLCSLLFTVVRGRYFAETTGEFEGHGTFYMAAIRNCRPESLDSGAWGIPVEANGKYEIAGTFTGDTDYTGPLLGGGTDVPNTYDGQIMDEFPDCSHLDPVTQVDEFVECKCGDEVASLNLGAGWNSDAGMTLAVFEPEFDTSPDSGKKCGDDCGSCPAGVPQSHLDGVQVYFPLGKKGVDEAGGYLQIRASELNQRSGDVNRLIANVDSSDLVKDVATQQILQVYTGENGVLVDIVRNPSELSYTPSTNEPVAPYRLDFYFGQGATFNSTTGKYTPSGSKFTATTVQFKVEGGVPKLRLVTTGQGADTIEYSQQSTTMQLRTGFDSGTSAYLRVDSRLESVVGATRTVIQIVANGALQPVSRRVEVWTTFDRVVDPAEWLIDPVNALRAKKEELTELKLGASTVEWVESRTYGYDLDPTDAGYGRLKTVTNSDGNWRVHLYDSAGRITRTISQWKDGTLNLGNLESTADSNRDEVFSYDASTDLGDADSLPELITTRVEVLGNVEVDRTYSVHWSQQVTWAGGGIAWPSGESYSPTSNEIEHWDVRWAGPGLPTNMASFLNGLIGNVVESDHPVEVSIREADAPYRTRVQLSSGGTVRFNDTAVSGIEETRTSVSSGIDPATLQPVTGGTKRVSVRTHRGTLLDSWEYDLQNPLSPILLSHSSSDPSLSEVDAFGRILVVNYLDGTKTTSEYDCCGLVSTVDRDGTRTEYERDQLKRQTLIRRQVGGTALSPEYISSAYTYDADGRVLSEYRIGTDASPMLVSTTTYDLQGRITQTTDALSRITTYARSVSNRIVYETVTTPDPDGVGPLSPATQIRATYSDGSELSTSGTGALPTSVGYHTILDGGEAFRMVTRARGSLATEWTRSYFNRLGQVVFVQYPDEAFERRSYNTLGQLVWSTDADSLTSLMLAGNGEDDAAYQLGFSAPSTVDWSGNWTLSASDAGTARTFDFAGPDRIGMNRTYLATRTDNSINYVVRRSESYVWDQDTNAPRLVSTNDTSIDGNHSWSEASERLSASTVVTDPATGTRTVTSIAPTGASTVSVSVYGRDISSTSYDSSSQFISSVNYEYDEHGRQISVTRIIDPLTPATNAVVETEYDSADRIVSITEPEPYAASPFGGRRTTTFAYDNLDRTIETDRGSGKVTHTTYSPTGQVSATWGFETNPVTMTYDDVGRLKTLTTYRTAPTNTPPSSWSDASTTTWNYDSERGWLTSKVYANSVGPSYTYTTAGRLATRTGASPRSIVTTYGYNDFGDLVSTDYSDSTPDVVIEPDRMGRPQTVYDAAGERVFTYDAEGRMLTESISSSGLSILAGVEVQNRYGEFGLREEHAASVSSTPVNLVSYVYDAEERLRTVVKGSMQATYSYVPHSGQVDKIGIAALNSSNVLVNVAGGVRTHDLLGRLNGVTWSKPGSPSTTPPTMPNAGTVLESYDYAYDIDNRRFEMAVKDGSEWQYEYDHLGQLSQAKRFNPTASAYYPGSQFKYEYDAIGNRTSVSQGGDFTGNNLYSSNYTANALNQYSERDVSGNVEVVGESLAPVVLVNGSSAAMTGDIYHEQLTFGNTTTPVQADVEIQEVPGNYSTWQVFIPETPEAFEYDADGNLTKDGIWTYEWDGENRLAAIQMRGDIAEIRLGNGLNWIRLEFAYDWLGRRIGKKYRKSTDEHPEKTKDPNGITIEWDEVYWEHYVYDGWLLSASYTTDDEGDNPAADRSYAWGPDLSSTRGGAGGIGGLAIYRDHVADNDGGTFVGSMFPIYDGNGNLTRMYRLAPGVGSVPDVQPVAQYEYGPFGELSGVSGPQGHRNPFRFSTKYTDSETGLVYYGYRYYSPSLGRWLSRDPLEEIDHSNVYAAISNSPIDRIDPLGLRVLTFGFNGFINGLRLGRWLHIPVPIPGHQMVETDMRDFGQFNWNHLNPNARVSAWGHLQSKSIGTHKSGLTEYAASTLGYDILTFPNETITATFATGISRQAEMDQHQNLMITDMRAGIHGGLQFYSDNPCHTRITLKAWGMYPFFPVGVDVAFEAQFDFQVIREDWVTVTVNGWHNAFPDYEAYVNKSLVYSKASWWSGPNPLNLGALYKTFRDQGMSVRAETPKSCICPSQY